MTERVKSGLTWRGLETDLRCGASEAPSNERDGTDRFDLRNTAPVLDPTINRGQELVIGGYVPGNPIDSIIVGYYQDGTLLYAGKVRNGFVPHTHSPCGSSQTDEGRDEKLQMGEARRGGADRVYRVDTGCASTAIRFRRPARRQRPAKRYARGANEQ